MVQYEKHESMELRPMPNYWKLQYRQLSTREMMRDELEASGAMGDHKVPKSLPLSELRKLLSRMDRGLMLYGKRPIQDTDILVELRAISHALGLPNAKTATKPQLIDTLEKADEQRTFHRFLDLPPELRVQIFTYHFEDLNSVIKQRYIAAAPPPPVTAVSRIVRQESLPVFYQIHRIRIIFFNGGSWDVAPSPNVRIQDMPLLSKHVLDQPEVLSRYGKFTLVAGLRATNGRNQVSMTYEVDLPQHKGEVSSTCKVGIYWRNESFVAPVEDMKAQVEKLFRAVEGREKTELRREDFEALRVIFENGARRVVVP